MLEKEYPTLGRELEWNGGLEVVENRTLAINIIIYDMISHVR